MIFFRFTLIHSIEPSSYRQLQNDEILFMPADLAVTAGDFLHVIAVNQGKINHTGRPFQYFRKG